MNYIISVCDPKVYGKLTEICRELNLPFDISFHGKGTAVPSMLDILGIESTERRIVFSFADEEKTKQLIELQKQRMFIGVPGHGITVALPVKSIGGGKTVAYLNGENKDAKYVPELKFNYELIVAIANAGKTDTVMNAARKAGARGGTVIHGKGTGGENTAKFYNVSIAEEKEVILIVSAVSEKAQIMRSILESAGPDTAAGTIVFSLPVSEAAGFGLI